MAKSHHWRITPEGRAKARWAVFHVALVVFACDLIAAVWPAFDHLWQSISRIGVALGVVFASVFEYMGALEEHRIHVELTNAVNVLEKAGKLGVEGAEHVASEIEGASNDP